MEVNWAQTAAVFIGGCAGGLARAALIHAFPDPAWPFTTFAINALGSFLLGFLLTWLARTGPDAGWRRLIRLGVGTGVIGGFTTYSSFAVASARLLTTGAATLALTYMLASLVVGIALALTGIGLAEHVTHGQETP